MAGQSFEKTIAVMALYEQTKEWPVVDYMWSFGLALVDYLVIRETVFESKPHPIH
jgi:hypothetical protein